MAELICCVLVFRRQDAIDRPYRAVVHSFVELAGIDFLGTEIDKALAMQEIEHGAAFV